MCQFDLVTRYKTNPYRIHFTDDWRKEIGREMTKLEKLESSILHRISNNEERERMIGFIREMLFEQ